MIECCISVLCDMVNVSVGDRRCGIRSSGQGDLMKLKERIQICEPDLMKMDLI